MHRLAIICFEDPRRVNGGVQRRIAAEIAYFARRGVEVVVLTAGAASYEKQGRVTYISVPTPSVAYPIRTLLFSARVSHYLRQLPAFDLIETHHDAGAAVLLAMPQMKTRQFTWVEFIHGVFRDEFASIRRHERLFSHAMLTASGLLPLSLIEQAAARRADAVITVSNYTAQQSISRYTLPRDAVHIIPNGIDPNMYTPSRRPKPHNERDACTIVYVGRWHARKGVMQLLRAFAAAHSSDKRLRLTMLGSGPLGPMLREESLRLGIHQAVELRTGADDKTIIQAYQDADIVCVPSLQEGQGIVALEAQACGAPVVATRAGGLAEAVRDGETGILVEPGDSPALAQALLQVAQDNALRHRLSANAVQWARSFAWEHILTSAAYLYDRLSAEKQVAV